jgi:hypothetical protein
MTIQFIENAKYYYKDSFYWVVGETELIQFTENFFNDWKPGTEMYYYKRRELSVMKPLDERQGHFVYKLLKKRIEKIEKMFKLFENLTD